MLVVTLLAGCRSDPAAPRAPENAAGPERGLRAAGEEWFVDRAADSGLNFTHFNGMSGDLYYPEIMPPGVGLLDYDNDSDLDMFLVQGQMLGRKKPSQALFPPPDSSRLKARLFRNDLSVDVDGTRSLRFTDVTDHSGIRATGYGMGIAAGDFDNDGCVDLYVTNLGPNQLLRNNCDGTFTDVSKQSRTNDPGWSVSASFVDFDRDGWLDLFVGHYLSYALQQNQRCFSMSGALDYCPPHIYRAEPSRLYHNNRDGTFSDATAASGMTREFGPALGVSTADFDNDRWIDIFVANDGQANQLWMNQRNGTFTNTALLAGAALGAEGTAKANMGVDAGDFDADGDEDLFITELTGQGVNLYVNDGSAGFEERSASAGLRLPTLPFTGFGTAWLDFDNDGWLDLVTVNGAVRLDVEAQARNEPFSLQQTKQLFRNLGNGRFEEVSGRAGAVWQLPEVGRGAAVGDLDNDGDVDVVVGNDSGPLRVLINAVGNRQHWLGLRLVGQQPPSSTREGRDMLGARVGVLRASRPMLWRRARADGSYGSANDPRVLVGLGESSEPVTVRVLWPGGSTEEWHGVQIDRYLTLKEGSGKSQGR